MAKTKTKTVLVTGASGFIAKHIVLRLLNEGYNVVGSLRSPARADEVINAVTPRLARTDKLAERLQFVTLDLTKDAGWEDAMEGVDALFHTASPFPMVQPDDENELIRPAVDGAVRALAAAHKVGVKRVVLTSSVAAVAYGKPDAPNYVYDHTDWTDLNGPGLTAYTKSKTMAEQAAWQFVRETAPEIELTTVNPALVLGAPLDQHYGTSLQLVERMLKASDPMLPKLSIGVIDVQDVARLHVDALSTKSTIGVRLVGASGNMSMSEMAMVLKKAYPNRKIVTREAPNALVRILSLFDKSIKGILGDLGIKRVVTGKHAEDLLGFTFISKEDTLKAAANFVVGSGKV